MAKQQINIGTSPNSKNGDPLRTSFIKINENFTELYDTVELLGGDVDPSRVISANVKGNIISSTDSIIINASTGKIAPNAIPDTVPLLYKFRAIFTEDGSLDSLDQLPTGWIYTRLNNVATITHTVGRHPSIVSYWGYSTSAKEFKLRYPSAGYQVKIEQGSGYPFSLNLNTAITGADSGEYALITVLF